MERVHDCHFELIPPLLHRYLNKISHFDSHITSFISSNGKLTVVPACLHLVSCDVVRPSARPSWSINLVKGMNFFEKILVSRKAEYS